MKIIGLDVGRRNVKVVSHNYFDIFPSVVGEYRELKAERSLGKTDIVLHYNGVSLFGGDLAIHESEFPVQDSRASKIHERTKWLAVMAMHRAVNDGEECLVVTGEPIGDHTPDNKEKFKKMLQGEYTAILNGIKKSWHVKQCAVAAEGAAAVWGIDQAPNVLHIIDPGSRTTNYAVTVTKGLYDRLSGTFDMGCETVRNMKPALFADAISAQLSRRWLQQMGPVMIIGGMAEPLKLEFSRYYQEVFVPENPVFATAKGMYELGVKLCETTAKR